MSDCVLKAMYKSGELGIKPACFRCGYMDKSLPASECYRCHCGNCPDLVMTDHGVTLILNLGWDYFK